VHRVELTDVEDLRVALLLFSDLDHEGVTSAVWHHLRLDGRVHGVRLLHPELEVRKR